MTPLPLPRFLIALWGVLGVELVLADALWRLIPRALGPLLSDEPLGAGPLATYAGSVLFLGFFEGYRGFQKAFAPRVAARALWLARHPSPLAVALAPLFVMALFSTTRRRLIASWLLIVGIVSVVIAVQQLPPLYRAAVDGGVVVGLGWGAIAVLASFVAGLRRGPSVDPELPPG